MSTEITLPQLGANVAAVTIERYYKQAGDAVEPGDPLVVVHNDRFEWELPATAAGTIADILAQPGATVPVGAALVRLSGDSAVTASETTNGRVARVTPVARKIAAVHGLDLAAVRGSGPSGTITRADVLPLVGGRSTPGQAGESAFNSCFTLDLPTQATITAPQPTAASVSAPESPRAAQQAAPQSVPFAAAQRMLAAHLVQCKTSIPHALTAVEVELSRVIAYVEAHQARLARRGIPLNVTACIAHAAVETLARHRMLNSVWSDEGIIVRGRIQLAVAGGQGAESAVAVIPGAADLSLQGLARAIGSRQQAESNVLEQLNAATFTVCDEAVSRWRHAIVPAAQGAILTLGVIERRPFVLEAPAGDTIVIRPLALLTLAYDARLATQPQADAFLTALKSRLEHFSPL